MKRGEIYLVNLNPIKGREQAGIRPVLVVSANEINETPLVISVVVGTDAQNVVRDYPTNVRTSSKETGLPLDTVFLCFQLRSLDHSRFIDPIKGVPVLAGKMPPGKMREVETALCKVLRLFPEPTGISSVALAM